MMNLNTKVTLFAGGVDSPEGPAFDRAGNFYHVDWTVSSIVKHTPAGVRSEFFNTGGIPAGLAFHPDGSLWAADEGADIHGLLRIEADGSSAKIVVNSYRGQPLNGANDLVFDRAGAVYFSDPWATSAENPAGGFYRYLPDGELQQIDAGLAFPNGVAIRPDETYVYLAETYRNRILCYEINSDGTLGPREHFADTATPSGPDGMAFDVEGNLYVAHFGMGRVDVFDPVGTLAGVIDLPAAGVTNCAFGGPANKTLYITEVASHSVYTAELDIAGLPLFDGR
jgi:gluconolactonase